MRFLNASILASGARETATMRDVARCQVGERAVDSDRTRRSSLGSPPASPVRT